jgi:hypothetical protein
VVVAVVADIAANVVAMEPLSKALAACHHHHSSSSQRTAEIKSRRSWQCRYNCSTAGSGDCTHAVDSHTHVLAKTTAGGGGGTVVLVVVLGDIGDGDDGDSRTIDSKWVASTAAKNPHAGAPWRWRRRLDRKWWNASLEDSAQQPLHAVSAAVVQRFVVERQCFVSNVDLPSATAASSCNTVRIVS